MSAAGKLELRPSLLPKLSKCGHYRPEANAGAAADRGTALDVVFRAMFTGEKVNSAFDDDEGATWAAMTAQALAAGSALEARESELKVKVGIAGMAGTADLLCAGGNWSGDLKSGQVRDYEAQQACYALGFMEQYFVDEWTVYLLYCDARHLERLFFTRESAAEIVRAALLPYLGGDPPSPNEYCGWCAARFGCAARREMVLGLVPGAADFEARLEEATGEQLRDFALAVGVLESFGERARELLKSAVVAGRRVAGVALTSKRGSRKVPLAALGGLRGLHLDALLECGGEVSEARARALWADTGTDLDFPEGEVTESPGSSYVRITKPKILPSLA